MFELIDDVVPLSTERHCRCLGREPPSLKRSTGKQLTGAFKLSQMDRGGQTCQTVPKKIINRVNYAVGRSGEMPAAVRA